jgi:hypothetical protein
MTSLNKTMKSFCLGYLTVCLLVGTIHAQQTETISSTQFGFHQDHILSMNPAEQPADIGFGTFRTWDTGCCQWYQIEKTQGQYTFTGADTILEELYGPGIGINDVLMTFGVGVPKFYSSNSTDKNCAYSAGICDAPVDVAMDGTGTDAHWIAFLQSAVAHFSDHTYLQNHAHVLYYELFNEFDRSTKVNNDTACLSSNGNEGSCQFQGTFSQLLRMQEDARCVIQGVGVIHGQNGVTCAESGINPQGIDPAATVIAGNVEGADPNTQRVVLQNFLYCNASPPTNSQCNWGVNNGKSNWGALADPVIVLHYYFANSITIPEGIINRIYQQRATLQTAELTKPYFAGEGSWLGNNTQTDPGLSAGFTARWWLSLLLAQNFATVNPGPIRGYWYNWDGGDNPGDNPVGIGGLWSTSYWAFNPPPNPIPPPISYLSCETPENGGYICTGGTAAKQIISWLVGQTWVTASCPTSCTNPTQGVFKIDISNPASSYQAEIAWDSTVHSQACSLYTHPEVCGNTSYTAPGYVTQYRDLAGGTHTSVPKVIGAEPIIAEN